MDSRRGRPTLAERGILPPIPGEAGPPVGRHCWITDPPGMPGRWAGVLVEWRRSGDAWEGLVSYVALVGGRPAVLQAWLDARRLAAVQPSRPVDLPRRAGA